MKLDENNRVTAKVDFYNAPITADNVSENNNMTSSYENINNRFKAIHEETNINKKLELLKRLHAYVHLGDESRYKEINLDQYTYITGHGYRIDNKKDDNKIKVAPISDIFVKSTYINDKYLVTRTEANIKKTAKGKETVSFTYYGLDEDGKSIKLDASEVSDVRKYVTKIGRASCRERVSSPV